MICETQFLGQFDSCDDIIIPEITAETLLTNEITRWNCVVFDENIGKLHKGFYTFYAVGQRYKFEVV